MNETGFPGQSKVLLSNFEEKEIRNLYQFDKVLDREGTEHEVSLVLKHYHPQEIVEIIAYGGRRVLCSKDQFVLMYRSGVFLPIKALNIDKSDYLIRYTKESKGLTSILAITLIPWNKLNGDFAFSFETKTSQIFVIDGVVFCNSK